MTRFGTRGWMRRAVPAGAAIAMVCLAGAAHAQADAKPAPLKGPTVRDNSLPGERGRFSGGGQRRPGDQPGMRAGEFIRALDAVRAPKAADGLALSADQETKIKAAAEAFRTSVREFAQANGAEVRELIPALDPKARQKVMQRLREAGLGGGEFGRPGRPGPDGERPDGKAKRPVKRDEAGARSADAPDEMAGPVDPAESAAALSRLEEIAKDAPRQEDLRKQVWSILTDGQRQAVEAELAAQRTANAEKRRVLGAEGAPAFDPENLPPQVKERLANMSPEERAKAIEKMKERRANAPKNRGARGGEKPAPPPIETVNIPQPK